MPHVQDRGNESGIWIQGLVRLAIFMTSLLGQNEDAGDGYTLPYRFRNVSDKLSCAETLAIPRPRRLNTHQTLCLIGFGDRGGCAVQHCVVGTLCCSTAKFASRTIPEANWTNADMWRCISGIAVLQHSVLKHLRCTTQTRQSPNPIKQRVWRV